MNFPITPFTTDVILKAGTIEFLCPTCYNTVSVTLQQIDPIVGVNAACSKCKNICHVPGIYKTNPNPFGSWITGSIQIPIAKFSDWYFENPFINALIKSGQPDLLFDYGLWAFCGACYHQFPATVLCSFAVAQRAGGFIFNARTPGSAKDMEALRAGHCSHCRHTNLIVVVVEIPDYVRNVIKSKIK